MIGALDLTDQASADQQSDDELVFNAGFLFNPNGTFSLGLVFKSGGEFQIPYVVNYEDSPRGPAVLSAARPLLHGRRHSHSRYLGGRRGLSAVPSLALCRRRLVAPLLAVEPHPLSGPFPTISIPPLTTELPPTQFSDVVQLNGGFERIFPGRPTVGLRGGFFHRPNFNKDGTLDAGATFGTVGLGLVFGDRGQLDMAASFSKNTSEGLVSLVIRF